MAVTIGALTINDLQALPIAYDEVNTRQGINVRAWDVDGLLTSADAAALSNAYEAWLATRKTEADTLLSNSVGTTVAFTGSAAGRSWSTVACWFDAAPKLVRAGIRWRVSFRLVHAAEALAALLAGERLNRERGLALELTFGTATFGTVTLTLLEDPDTRGDGPTVTTAATGTDLIEGPLRPVKLLKVRGYGPRAGNADYLDLLTWYDTACATRPTAGTYYPISPPVPSPRVIVDGTGKVTRYEISFEARLIA